jgi:hypothetical protein
MDTIFSERKRNSSVMEDEKGIVSCRDDLIVWNKLHRKCIDIAAMLNCGAQKCKCGFGGK